MIGIRTSHPSSRATARRAAVVIRLTAFVVAAASVVLIPAELAAAALGTVPTGPAFEVVAGAATLTLAMVVAARGVDPLRG